MVAASMVASDTVGITMATEVVRGYRSKGTLGLQEHSVSQCCNLFVYRVVCVLVQRCTAQGVPLCIVREPEG